MKKIKKGKEPKSLTRHRASINADYANMPTATKNDLRKSLIEEQGSICCYCMKRISITAEMKVEHYKCQRHHPQLQLVYTNMLGACRGNEGGLNINQTCDTKKADRSLVINPLISNPNCESLIKYSADGAIFAEKENINSELNDILNLNMQSLKDSRKQIYEEVQNIIENEGRRAKGKKIKKGFIKNEIKRWLSKDDAGKYKSFCMVAVYLLEKSRNRY